MNRRLPVTLIGGFLGAGKTSVLHHIISEHQGGNLATIVENPGPLNLDSKAIAGLCGAARRTQDVVISMPADDEAKQIGWLAGQLSEIAAIGRFEQVLVEVAGTSSAARLGRHFGVLPGHGEELSAHAELRQVICVIDALDFVRGFVTPERAPQGWIDFQRAQIEGATLVVLNKCDLVDQAQRDACAQMILGINPVAAILETAFGAMDAEIFAKTASAQELGLVLEPRLAAPVNGNGASEGPPLTSALYRAYRPFHPERFWNWLDTDFPELLRVKGVLWLASRNLLVGAISRTRWQIGCGPAGIWWAALPREEWPQEPALLRQMQETWREPYGDRRQELVLLGSPADVKKATQGLNACLLREEEFNRPVLEWASLTDPFPVWDLTKD